MSHKVQLKYEIKYHKEHLIGMAILWKNFEKLIEHI